MTTYVFIGLIISLLMLLLDWTARWVGKRLMDGTLEVSSCDLWPQIILAANNSGSTAQVSPYSSLSMTQVYSKWTRYS
jgi:hypothetical protein